MDYQKKYPILQTPNDFVVLQWERGFQRVQIIYHDVILDVIENRSVIQQKKYKKRFDNLGTIELSFPEEKLTSINVVVDGLHSPANPSYPSKNLGAAATILWFIVGFAVAGTIFEVFVVNAIAPDTMAIILGIDMLIVAVYAASAILTKRGHTWGFYVGFGLYTITTLLYILSILGRPNLLSILVLIIRGVFMFWMIRQFPILNRAARHKRYEKHHSRSDLLDS